MGFFEKALYAFLTEENIKKYVHYIFDNNLLDEPCCKFLFESFQPCYAYNVYPSNSFCRHPFATFYQLVIFYLDLDCSHVNHKTNVMRALDTLSIYPPFFKHLIKMRELEQINRPPPFNLDNTFATTPFDESLCAPYDETAFYDFLTEENVKQFTLFMFEKQENHFRNGRETFASFLDLYFSWRFKQYKNYSTYWHFCEYLKDESDLDNIIYNHQCFCGFEPYNEFVKKHVTNRKARLVYFHEQIYDEYDGCNIVNKVFADEYVVMRICLFL